MAEEKQTVMPQKKVRCLFVLPSLAGGGAEKVTLTLFRTKGWGHAPLPFWIRAWVRHGKRKIERES